MAEIDRLRRSLATRLRMSRQQAGLSQGQVADLLGLRRPAISEIEAARRRVLAGELAQLARIYDVNMAWLATGTAEDDPYRDQVELAARELSKLKRDDVDTILNLLSTLRKASDVGNDD